MKAIVSVFGRDKQGIIAGVSATLLKLDANIEDINQTIMQNKYFTMLMMVDFPSDVSIDIANTELSATAKTLDVEIHVQHTDIFNSQHRI
ncbi:MAG: ACT domain-containing protein [Clostridia bacterium]